MPDDKAEKKACNIAKMAQTLQELRRIAPVEPNSARYLAEAALMLESALMEENNG